MRRIPVVILWISLCGAETLRAQVPTVTTSPVTPLYATSAQLNGTVNPRGQATVWYFQIGRTTSYELLETDVIAIGSGTLTVDANVPIVGLKTDSVYHYRIVAWNPTGPAYGSDVAFTLNANSGKTASWTPQIMWLQTWGRIKDSTFDLQIIWCPSWGVTQHDTTRTEMVEYDRNGNFTGRLIDHWCLGDTLDFYKDTIKGLFEGYQYYMRSRNSNKYGPSPWSEMQTITGAPIAEPPALVIPKNGTAIR